VEVGGVELPGTVRVDYTGNASGDRALAVRELANQSGLTQVEINRALSENDITIHHYIDGEMQLVHYDLNEIPHAGMASALRAGNVSLSDGIGFTATKAIAVLGIYGLLTDPASVLGGPTTTMGDATVTGAYDRARDTLSYPNGIDTKYVQGALDLLQTGLTIGAMDDPANFQSYLSLVLQNSVQGGTQNAPPSLTLSKH
jgi:hypothetical protein